MKNFVQSGDTITATAPYTLTGGQGAKVGTECFGVACGDAASGASVELKTSGVYDITALSTDTGTVGTPMYWDDGNRRLTTTSSTHLKVGYLVAAKGSGDTTARIRLKV